MAYELSADAAEASASDNPHKSSLREVALQLAGLGFAVFPCEVGGKRPLTERGFKDATTDSGQIDAWWEQWPSANPGLATGASDVTVIDLDVDKTTSECIGETSWEVLRIEEDLPKPNFRVRTPSGGWHLYYAGATLPQSVGKLGDGIDVRSSTGYVVAPGAVIEGKTYEADGPIPYSFELEELPQAIINRANETGSGKVRACGDPGEWRVEPDLDANVAHARRFLENEVKQDNVSIEHQGGNDHLYKTIALLRDFGVSEEKSVALLQQTGWNDACRPPWLEEELTYTAGNVKKYAKSPGGWRAVSEAFKGVEVAQPEPGTKSEAEANGLETGQGPGDDLDEYIRLAKTPLEQDQEPEPEWLIDGLIHEQGLAIAYGPSGSYKSFISTDLIEHLIAGRDWHKMFKINGKKTVLAIIAEDDDIFKGQRAAWEAYYEVRGSPETNRLIILPVAPSLLNSGDQNKVWRAIEHFKPDLVLVDTLKATFNGEENSSQDIGDYINFWKRTLAHFKCAGLLVHHSGKDASQGMRGSSALHAAAKTVLSIKKNQNGLCEVLVEKQKGAPNWVNPLYFKTHPVLIEGAKRPGMILKPAEGDGVKPPTEQDVNDTVIQQATEHFQTVSKTEHQLWCDTAQEKLEEAFQRDDTGKEVNAAVKVRDLAKYVAEVFGVNSDKIYNYFRDNAWKPGEGLHGYQFEPAKTKRQAVLSYVWRKVPLTLNGRPINSTHRLTPNSN